MLQTSSRTQTRPPRQRLPRFCGVARVGYQRWMICALLFFAATINYVDRQVIGLLKPTLQAQFGWSEIDYADIVFAFQLAYAIGLLMAGRLMDRLGARVGFALAIVVWSLAAMAHAEAEAFGGIAGAVLAVVGLTYTVSVAGFIFARFALGLGEAGQLPGVDQGRGRVVPEARARACDGHLQLGYERRRAGDAARRAVDHDHLGLVLGVRGDRRARVLLAGLVVDRVPPARAASEASARPSWRYIRSDPAEPTVRVPWRTLLKHRQTWAFAIGKFLTDPVWWLYLFWIPDFLNRNHGLDLTSVGPPLVAIYLVADVGSIGGGWLSSTLMKRGISLNRARKTAMLACALAVLPIAFAAGAQRVVGRGGDHQRRRRGASGVVGESLHADVGHVPASGRGSVVGLGGMAGAIGGMLIAKLTGYILQATGSYVPVFLIAASAYLIALAVIHVLMPKLEPARLEP